MCQCACRGAEQGMQAVHRGRGLTECAVNLSVSRSTGPRAFARTSRRALRVRATADTESKGPAFKRVLRLCAGLCTRAIRLNSRNQGILPKTRDLLALKI